MDYGAIAGDEPAPDAQFTALMAKMKEMTAAATFKLLA